MRMYLRGAAVVALMTAGVPATAGTLVVSGDEWQLSNSAYGAQYAAGTTQFVDSLAYTFGGSNYLFLTGNYNVQQSALSSAAAQFEALGKTVSYATTFDAGTATSYDAVFHFGQLISQTALKSYVDGGGNAYVSLGAGYYGTAAGEAAAWNPVLASYGLVAGSSWFTTPGFAQVTVTSGPSDSLIWGYGQSIEVLPGSLTAQNYVRGKFSANGVELGLVGTSQPLLTSAVPEPATWAFMIAGFAAVGIGMRRRTRQNVQFA